MVNINLQTLGRHSIRWTLWSMVEPILIPLLYWMPPSAGVSFHAEITPTSIPPNQVSLGPDHLIVFPGQTLDLMNSGLKSTEQHSQHVPVMERVSCLVAYPKTNCCIKICIIARSQNHCWVESGFVRKR